MREKWKGCSLRDALNPSGMNAKTRINTCEIVFGTLHLKKKSSSSGSGTSLVMRRLIRPQHAQRQWELPKFTSRLWAFWSHPTSGTGAMVGSQSVWPHRQRQADHTILGTVLDSLVQPVLPVQPYRSKGSVLGHPSSPAQSCFQLAQITPEQMGQVSACIPQLRAREEYSDKQKILQSTYFNNDSPPGKHVVLFREIRKRAIFFL